MPSFIRATVDDVAGWVELSFGYSKELINQIKMIPGSRWNPDRKVWRSSLHAWAVLSPMLIKMGHKIEERIARTHFPARVVPDQIASRLRPYQIEGASFLLNRTGALLTMDPRTGKTPTSIGAVTGAMSAGIINAVLITYPASVAGEWLRQLKQWANVDLVLIRGTETIKKSIKKAQRDANGGKPLRKKKGPLAQAGENAVTPEIDVEALLLGQAAAQPFLFVGCHYEILDSQKKLIAKMLNGRKYAVVADEVHHCKNRKAERTKALHELRMGAVFGWGLTGTPMRNRTRDMWGIFEFVQPEGIGGYWSYAKRYSGAIQGAYGWEDGYNTNTDELAQRLRVISYRKTRAEVAGWLPKSDRRVIECAASADSLKKYRALEKVFADRATRAIKTDGKFSRDDAALKEMVLATSEAKIPTAIERIRYHAQRGVKHLVFCHFHESLRALIAEVTRQKNAEEGGFDAEPLPAIFACPGWEAPEKRREIIQAWKDHDGPAALLANTLASGIGIDLSDAEGASFLELEWVPSDFRQAEDRVQDVHQGKRTAPAFYEYLICRATIDESMANALFSKIRNIEKVVGSDQETSGVASTLQGANFVDNGAIGLKDAKDETINDAIEDLLGIVTGEKKRDPGEAALDALASSIGASWDDGDDEEPEDDPTKADDDIPF